MRCRLTFSLVFLLVYAFLLGLFSWRTFFSYVRPDYRNDLQWEAPWISAIEPDTRTTYFRKTLYLTSEPSRAWLAVKALDSFDLFVNGHRFHKRREYVSGFALSVTNISPYLTAGVNVIGVRNEILTYPEQPRIQIQGEVQPWTGPPTQIRSDASWRTASRDETLTSQGGIVKPSPWFSPQFDDGRWAHAVEGRWPNQRGVQPLDFPPLLLTEPLHSGWIWAPQSSAPEAYLRTNLTLPTRPRDAWLRIAAKRGYRLFVNGYLLADREDAFGTRGAAQSPLRFYNISGFLRRGSNILALQAASDRVEHGLMIDGFAEGWDRSRRWVSSLQWRASVAPETGWETLSFDDSHWEPATLLKPVTREDHSILESRLDRIRPPLSFSLRSFSAEALTILVSVAACWLLWAGSARGLARLTGADSHVVAHWLPLTFLPPAALLIIAYLLGFDIRLWRSFPYETSFVLGSVALLLLLHVALFAGAVAHRLDSPIRRSIPAEAPDTRRMLLPAPIASVLLAGALTLAGFALRFENVTRESLVPDEITSLMTSEAVFQRGYPSLVLAGRVKPTTTSELVFYFKALTIWWCGPNALGLRLHDVLFGTLTIPLLYAVGKRLHTMSVGLLAAALYAIQPSVIGMTHYSRYPSQEQFFALLTFGLFYRAIGEEVLRPSKLYLAAISFLATYLSWEGSVFFLPSIALGLLALTRPAFGWLKNKHTWVAAGLIALVVFLQLSFRFLINTQWLYYGSGIQDASLAPTWRYPFYDPMIYFFNFFTLRNHHLLTLVFVLTMPLWFGLSRERRVLGFLATTIIVDVFVMTNCLDLQHWRYVYYLFPLLVLSASMGIVMFAESLTRLCSSVTTLGALVRGIRHATVLILVVSVVTLSTTYVVNLNLPWSSKTTFYTRLGAWTFAEEAGAGEYIREHALPGDIVFSQTPTVVGFYAGRADYYLESRLMRPLLLGKDPGLPIQLVSGLPTIGSASALEELLARSSRVWYVALSGDSTFLDGEMKRTLKREMREVYEDVHCRVYVSWPGRLL